MLMYNTVSSCLTAWSIGVGCYVDAVSWTPETRKGETEESLNIILKNLLS